MKKNRKKFDVFLYFIAIVAVISSAVSIYIWYKPRNSVFA